MHAYLAEIMYYNDKLEFWVPNVKIANLYVLTKAFASLVPFPFHSLPGRQVLRGY